MGIEIEIIKNLNNKDSYKYIKDKDKSGELTKFIPQMLPMKQVGECKYHVINCFDHSLYALEILENSIKDNNFLSTHLREYVNEYLYKEIEKDITMLQLLKLGILFHDIGKPKSKSTDKDGRVRFRNHENIGANIVLDIVDRLNLNKDSKEIVRIYVKYHMILLGLYKSNDMSKIKLDDTFNEVGDYIIGLLLLGYADIVSTRILLNPNEDSNIIKSYMEYIMTNYIYRYKMNDKI